MADEPKKISLFDAPPEPKPAQPKPKPSAPKLPLPALPKLPEQRAPVAPRAAPDERCDRCSENRVTEARFVAINHSPTTETKYGVFETSELTVSRLDHYGFALCDECRGHSDELYRRNRAWNRIGIVAVCAAGLALVFALLGAPAFVLLGGLFGGLAVFGVAVFMSWYVEGNLVDYLPVGLYEKRRVAMYTRSSLTFVKFLQRNAIASEEALSRYDSHW